MKKILIYQDKGADPFCVSSLLFALRYEKLNQNYLLTLVKKEIFQNSAWQKETELVIFPGGRDIPYHQALKGEGNQQIKDFVQNGGKFLGICAGGYYGSATIEFEQGGPLEVLANRELGFFPGIARGPIYGLGKFCYQSEQGAQIAQLHLGTFSTTTAAYYNGGCAFMETEKYPHISVIARYSDIEKQPAAIVKCQVGKGQAILSGVHPEYSTSYEGIRSRIKEDSQFFELKKIEHKRRTLLISILNQLDLC